MFLSSDDKAEDTPTLKKAQMELGPHHPILEPTQSPSPEIVAVEPTPAQLCKGSANAQVAEADKVLQSVVKQGYPDHAYRLGWMIYIGSLRYPEPVINWWEKCAGDVSVIARPVSPEVMIPGLDYEAKEEKDGREAEVKERGTKTKAKGKAKDKGSTGGSSSISSKGILGTRTSMLVAEERVAELVKRSENMMRNVSMKLNELNGAVLELEGPGDD
ncbi:hypothetical protein JB92DRAFT_3116960 [Gautieria morchelliformis]|nr:hypothetical protein JB92DRAFT_3116960 [Gautieria morchelliformis]